MSVIVCAYLIQQYQCTNMKLKFILQMFHSTPGPTQDAKKLTHKLYTFLGERSVENVIERTSSDVRFSRHTSPSNWAVHFSKVLYAMTIPGTLLRVPQTRCIAGLSCDRSHARTHTHTHRTMAKCSVDMYDMQSKSSSNTRVRAILPLHTGEQLQTLLLYKNYTYRTEHKETC